MSNKRKQPSPQFETKTALEAIQGEKTASEWSYLALVLG